MTIWPVLSGFRGRISRLMFWKIQLQLVLIEIGIGIGTALLAINETTPRVILFALAGLMLAFYLWTVIIIVLKRLHDIDKSAHYLWLFVIAPTALGLIAHFAGFGFLIIPGFLLELWGLIETGLRRGTVGPNRFGADPLADGNAPAAVR